MAATYPSRRYESFFRTHVAILNSSNTILAQATTNWSQTSASTSSRIAISKPASGYAFLRDCSTAGWLVAEGRGGVYTNPTSAEIWYDAVGTPPWGRVPNTIKWYSTAGVEFGSATASGIYSNTIATNKYLFGIGFVHPINIQNDSIKDVTIEYRVLNTFSVSSGVMAYSFTSWTELTISSGDTTTITGAEPIEIRFSPNAIGNNHAYSVTDQYGSTRRIEVGDSDYILKTSDESIIDTPISSGLLAADDGPIIIGDYIEEVWVEGDQLLFADIGSSPGSLLHGTIGDGADKLLHEAMLTEQDTDPPGEPGDEPGEDGYIVGFAVIVISWSGGYDLDCCAYWTDVTANKLGWGYSSGSTVNAAWMAEWTGDDRGTGPEYIQLGTTAATIASGVTTKTYRIHLNFYGSVTGTPLATVTAKFNGVTISGTVTPSTNSFNGATTSDPYVTITFNANGTPASIV